MSDVLKDKKVDLDKKYSQKQKEEKKEDKVEPEESKISSGP